MEKGSSSNDDDDEASERKKVEVKREWSGGSGAVAELMLPFRSSVCLSLVVS
jgi:hypothetical protein